MFTFDTCSVCVDVCVLSRESGEGFRSRTRIITYLSWKWLHTARLCNRCNARNHMCWGVLHPWGSTRITHPAGYTIQSQSWLSEEFVGSKSGPSSGIASANCSDFNVNVTLTTYHVPNNHITKHDRLKASRPLFSHCSRHAYFSEFYRSFTLITTNRWPLSTLNPWQHSNKKMSDVKECTSWLQVSRTSCHPHSKHTYEGI